MNWEDVRKEQVKEAMDLVKRGNEPDNIMLLTPEEYAKSMPSCFEFSGESGFDLMRSLPEAFPVSLIGSKDLLEPYDMSIYSFASTTNHPVKRYLDASVMALKRASTEDLTPSQLNKQYVIYATLYEVTGGALAYYQEEIIAEREAVHAPHINYLERKERENDVRACEIIIAGLEQMVKRAQEGINAINQLSTDVKQARE